MQTFIMLARWTQKGLEDLKSSTSRLDAAKKAFTDAGGSIKAFYLTTGQYDMITVCEMPDANAMAKLMLSTSALGAIRTETLVAFPEAEYRSLMGSLK